MGQQCKGETGAAARRASLAHSSLRPWAMWAAAAAMAAALWDLSGCGGRIEVEGEAPDAGALPLDAAAADRTANPPDVADAGSPESVDASMDDASRPQDADADALPTVICDAGQPVAVCVEYFALLSSCTGQDYLYLACQSGLIPDGGDDQQIEQICALNLQRLQQACR